MIEPIPSSQPPTGAKVYYMPHHAIIHEDKSTTKSRVVFDAFTKFPDSVSLNDCLYSGPKYNQNILDILLRFRVHHIAISSDIEKAFLMVSMSEEDRDALSQMIYPGY